MDKQLIASAVKQILEALGPEVLHEGTAATPERVADMYEEVFAGVGQDPAEEIDVFFQSEYDEMIAVRDISMQSFCEHHFVPFTGRAHVAYIPNEEGQITGLSKIARVVDSAAKRPQVQERLTMQIADAIERKLRPRGVMVVIEAEHLCMSVRGVKKAGSLTVTSAVRGMMRENLASREEAMRLLGTRV